MSNVTYTPNLGLRIDRDLTANARANLYKLDQLGAVYRLNANGSLFIRSTDSITIQPGDPSIGGTPGTQNLILGTVDNPIATLEINATAITLSSKLEYQYIDLTNSIVNADVNESAAIAYSKLNLTNSIVNADIAAAAAIAYSKLNLSNSIRNTDVAGNAAIAYSKLNLTLSLLNSDISPAAAISRAKLASGTPDYVLINDGAGNASQEQFLSKSRGGFAQDMSAATFPNSGVYQTDSNISELTGKTMDGTLNAFSNIGYDSLNLTDSIVLTDLNSSISIPYDNLNLNNRIKNSDVSGTAAIDGSKIWPSFGSQFVTTESGVRWKTGSFYVGFIPPPSLGTTTLWTLPAVDGLANQVLVTDGFKNLTWAAALTSSLNEQSILIGNASNEVQSTNTALLGDIEASTDSGLIIKPEIIDNADISPTAAIDYSKLNLASSILNTDLGEAIEVSSLNILGTPKTGSKFYFDGTNYRKDGSDTRKITVRSSGIADYNSLQDAIFNITDASESNQYTIEALGVFNEDITLKPYIHITSPIGLSTSNGPLVINGRLTGFDINTTLNGLTVNYNISTSGSVHTLTGSITISNSIFTAVSNITTGYTHLDLSSNGTIVIDNCSIITVNTNITPSSGNIVFGLIVTGLGNFAFTGSSIRTFGLNLDTDVTATGMFVRNSAFVGTLNSLIEIEHVTSTRNNTIIGIRDLPVFPATAGRDHQTPQIRATKVSSNHGTFQAFRNDSGTIINVAKPIYKVSGFAVTSAQNTSAGSTTLTTFSSTNINMPPTGAGANFLTPYHDAKTGFISWLGSGAYWSITGGNQFNLLRSFVGAVRSNEVECLAGQSVILTADATNYIYSDSKGVLRVSTISSDDVYYDGVSVFQVFYDGTNVVVVREDHPYSFDSAVSGYIHKVNGTIISGTGANITVANPYVSVLGDAELLDHGITTFIPSTLGENIIWNTYYKDNLGRWRRQALSNLLPLVYNNAGTPTPLDVNNFGVYRLYVSKDSLNSASPTYFAIMSTAQFNNQAAAQTHINSGLPPIADGSLVDLEVAQLGYVIVRNAATSIIAVTVAKQTVGATISGGAASNNAVNIIMNTNTFDKILNGTHTTAQAVAEALDELTHNKLNTKQGGTTDEYYHLPQSAHDALVDVNAQLANLHTDGNPTFNDLTVSGDLLVQGSTTTSYAEEVHVGDNLIIINNGEVGAGVTAGTAGIQVDRGSLDDYQFLFDESDDRFKIGTLGNLQPVATREDTPIDDGIAYWDIDTNRFVTSKLLKPYTFTFNTTSDWVLDGDEYYITVTAVTHGRGTTAVAFIDGSANVVNSVSGDMTIRVSADPDYRFAGTMIIN